MTLGWPVTESQRINKLKAVTTGALEANDSNNGGCNFLCDSSSYFPMNMNNYRCVCIWWRANWATAFGHIYLHICGYLSDMILNSYCGKQHARGEKNWKKQSNLKLSGAHFSSEGLMRPDVPLMAPSVSRRMNCSHTFHINAGETKWNCLPHPSLWAINSGASFQPTWCPVSDTLAFCKQDGNLVISQYQKRWTRVNSIGINACACACAHARAYAGSHPVSAYILFVCILVAEGCLFIWLQWPKVRGAGPGWGVALALAHYPPAMWPRAINSQSGQDCRVCVVAQGSIQLWLFSRAAGVSHAQVKGLYPLGKQNQRSASLAR